MFDKDYPLSNIKDGHTKKYLTDNDIKKLTKDQKKNLIMK